jgi:hypothetical protein
MLVETLWLGKFYVNIHHHTVFYCRLSGLFGKASRKRKEEQKKMRIKQSFGLIMVKGFCLAGG